MPWNKLWQVHKVKCSKISPCFIRDKDNLECDFVLHTAHVPQIPEEVLFHNVFQEEVTEMVDNPAVLKHLKQQVVAFLCTI